MERKGRKEGEGREREEREEEEGRRREKAVMAESCPLELMLKSWPWGLRTRLSLGRVTKEVVELSLRMAKANLTGEGTDTELTRRGPRRSRGEA